MSHYVIDGTLKKFNKIECSLQRLLRMNRPSLKTALIATFSVIGVHAAFSKRYQCSETLRNANVRLPFLSHGTEKVITDNPKLIANELQAKYWNASSGMYKHGELWTDAVGSIWPSVL